MINPFLHHLFTANFLTPNFLHQFFTPIFVHQFLYTNFFPENLFLTFKIWCKKSKNFGVKKQKFWCKKNWCTNIGIKNNGNN